LDLIRCPYCGGRADFKDSFFHRTDGDDIIDGLLGCQCCYFAVVSGIAVMTIEGSAEAARDLIEHGKGDDARRLLLGIGDHTAQQLEDPAVTYRDAVQLLGASFESGYFLYRFSDPTFLVADGVARSLAASLPAGGRAIDLCGGSGHLTRTLDCVSGGRVVLMDLSFVKLWLARRFTVPGCQAVCADAHAPLPFASSAFRLAICNDAFHYVWTKTLFAREMLRIVDRTGAAAITHVHNADQWNPSAGNPLPPRGYENLFEDVDVRLFSERGLLKDLLDGHVNLARNDSSTAIESDPSLTVVASRGPDVFVDRSQHASNGVQGRLAINPLYGVQVDDRQVRLCLRFPSADYEEEYRACKLYLPESLTIDRATLRALDAGVRSADVDDLLRRRVVLDLPLGYS
jgi:SAM-dependent methyltransferase